MSKEYVAGWWDGEGCFGVYVRLGEVNIRASASGCFKPTLDQLAAQYGGRVSAKRTRDAAKHRQAWEWKIVGGVAAKFATELLPFLHEQAVSVTAHRFGNPDHAMATLPL